MAFNRLGTTGVHCALEVGKVAFGEISSAVVDPEVKFLGPASGAVCLGTAVAAGDVGAKRVSDGQVHVAILVDVDVDDVEGAGVAGFHPFGAETSAGVNLQSERLAVAALKNIHVAVVIDVRPLKCVFAPAWNPAAKQKVD